MKFRPNLFILGAAKCGTTTLWAYLHSVDEICMSSPKEPHFFGSEFRHGLDYYRRRYFRFWKQHPIVGEASHRNLYLPYVAERIHTVNPDAKLIVVLRNPVDRAYSHWWHFYSRGRERLSFARAIARNEQRLQSGAGAPSESSYVEDRRKDPTSWDRGTYLDSGYYHEQIERYRELFAEDQLRVVLLEDLRTDPYAVVCELHDFLECSPVQRDGFELPRENTHLYRTPRWILPIDRCLARQTLVPEVYCQVVRSAFRVHRRPAMKPSTREFLTAHYADHNRRLAALLNRDLSSWHEWSA